jgi:hypothetical protein
MMPSLEMDSVMSPGIVPSTHVLGYFFPCLAALSEMGKERG